MEYLLNLYDLYSMFKIVFPERLVYCRGEKLTENHENTVVYRHAHGCVRPRVHMSELPHGPFSPVLLSERTKLFSCTTSDPSDRRKVGVSYSGISHS